MLKKKKIVLITVISFLLVLLTFFIIIFFKNDNNTYLDLEKINNSFTEYGDFNLSNMQDITKEYIIDNMKINEEYIKNYIGKIPMINISSSMYLVIETLGKNEAQIVMEDLEKFAIEYEHSWGNYLLSERNLIENRKIGVKGNFVYIIISENSLELEKMLK